MLTSYYHKKDKPLETDLSRASLLKALHDSEGFLWVDLESPSEFESEALVEIFNFHDLAVEDCVSDLSHPKVDDYEEYLFLVIHAVDLKDANLNIVELDVFLGKNFVVTFHKEPVKSIDVIREAARRKPDSYLGSGGDILVYKILDLVVDHYLPILEGYEDVIDQIEDQIFHAADKDCLEEVVQLKRDVFHFRRTVAPQRDALNYLTRNTNPFVNPENRVYFRDVYDHLFRIYGTIEGFHEAITGVLQAYFSYSSHRLNQTIQRMTVMATLSMPAVMIASIYGMNFQHMPELSHPLGYFFALSFMAVTSVAILVWMKWKKWI